MSDSFKDNCNKFRVALKECGALKSEYKHNCSELCNEFKSLVDENTEISIVKGYKQQVKMIKVILEKIEQLIFEYNAKKNKVENDNAKFDELYDSVNSLVGQLQSIA